MINSTIKIHLRNTLLHSRSSSSSSATARRRPRMCQPSFSYRNTIRQHQLLQGAHWNNMRMLSLSISSDYDSGEANAEAKISQCGWNGTGQSIISHGIIDSDHGIPETQQPIYNQSYLRERMVMHVDSSEIRSYEEKNVFVDNVVSAAVRPQCSDTPLQEPVSEARNIDNVGVDCKPIDGKDQDSIRIQKHYDENTHSNVPEQQTPVVTQQIIKSSKDPVRVPPLKHPLVSRLAKCVYDRDVKRAINAFYSIMEFNRRSATRSEPTIEIQPGLTKGLFNLIQPRHPLDLYRVMEYFISLPSSHENSFGATSDFSKYYRTACDSLRYVEPREIDQRIHGNRITEQLVELVSTLLSQIRKLDRPGQEMCFPVLLSSICEQPYPKIGTLFAYKVYKYMIDENIPVSDKYWLHILSFCKFNRHDMPYDEILGKAVLLGLRPNPILALNVLESLFPFSNHDAVANTLKVLLTLQRQVAAEITAAKIAAMKDGSVQVDDVTVKQYFIDIHLLETIGATAASQGQSEICLLIWDILDVLEYKPTVGIYENTVVAFAMNVFTYREAFTVLYEMEIRGFLPSRALIRSVSVHVRDSVRNMDFAQMQISQLRQENNIEITTSMMNVLMSSAAERGDIDCVLSLLKDFERYNIAFNDDSISFGFESLGKNLLRRRNFNGKLFLGRTSSALDHIDACMVVADVLLSRMDDHQVKTSDHIIRNYVEFLCLAGHVDTATSIILEAVQEKGLVSSKSIYRVAMANAKMFRFDIARQVATCDHSAPKLEFLMESIDREMHLYEASLKVERNQESHFDPLPKDDTLNSDHINISDRVSRPKPESFFWE